MANYTNTPSIASITDDRITPDPKVAERLLVLRRVMQDKAASLEEAGRRMHSLAADLASPGDDAQLETECFRALFDSMRPSTINF